MRIFVLFLVIIIRLQAELTIPNASKQLIVVEANDFNSSVAQLQAYERADTHWHKKGEPIQVNLGRNGLGWGIGLRPFRHFKNEPLKKEGDGKSPAGLFNLGTFFGYKEHSFKFPYIKVTQQYLCIDDSSSPLYNTLVQSKDSSAFKSYENMRREDNLYKLGIVIKHNVQGERERGSCIFIHIQRDTNTSTAGCTSLEEKKLLELMQWLDEKKKPLLLQLPKQYLKNFPNDYK